MEPLLRYMTTYITADWHLGEDRLALLGRPFTNPNDHVQHLLKEHNSMVQPTDQVILVGDAVYQNAPHFLERIHEFNGVKTLIRGNHDRIFTDAQLSPYFQTIIPEGQGIEMSIDDIPCFITHYPTQSRTDRFNLVGHIHGDWRVQLNMLNVGVDVHHFRPLPLSSIKGMKTAIESFYDNDVWVAYNPLNSQYLPTRGKKSTYFTPPY
jgi:calcineurin-like phosphoesterase family protein